LPQVFAVAPSVTLGLGSLPPERLKYASGLFNMMRNLGGAIAIAVCGAVLNSRTNLHFERIASHLTPANPAVSHFIVATTQRYAAIPGAHDSGQVAALRALWRMAYAQASTLAYADAFRVLMAGCFAAALLVPLMKKVSQAPASASAH